MFIICNILFGKVTNIVLLCVSSSRRSQLFISVCLHPLSISSIEHKLLLLGSIHVVYARCWTASNFVLNDDGVDGRAMITMVSKYFLIRAPYRPCMPSMIEI
ncbi:hypothetical protein QVD17_37663 [Tagetes erecta]|uniref:Uncharacterized protein n=1 Tax=Tagetes erecta TaxID=13708 RepID=A0AAD8JWS9_TARER|nr:hypothetical protein QVD17_37663 [Tagetes erecta]